MYIFEEWFSPDINICPEKVCINMYILYKKRNRLTDLENKLMVSKGESWGEGKRYIKRLRLTYTHWYI